MVLYKVNVLYSLLSCIFSNLLFYYTAAYPRELICSSVHSINILCKDWSRRKCWENDVDVDVLITTMQQ